MGCDDDDGGGGDGHVQSIFRPLVPAAIIMTK